MTYQIFVSYSSKDTQIAQATTTVLNDAFEGYIELFMATQEIVVGSNWKIKLQERLEESDAIISIITPNSLISPWIYIEWSPFWLKNKNYYVLLTDEIKVTDLVAPMRDIQVVDMMNSASVKGLLKALKEASKATIGVPYAYAKRFILDVKSAQETQKEEALELEYGVYRDKRNLDTLPNDDHKKRQIAQYFYQNNEKDVFLRIASKIRNDVPKGAIALELLDDNDVETSYKLSKFIRSSEQLGHIVFELIDQELFDSPYLHKLIEDISKGNQAELRKIALYLAQQRLEDTDIFDFVTERITNMAEFKKIAIFFIENNRYENDIFDAIIVKIGDANRPALAKVALEFMKHNLQRSSSFMWIMDKLFDEHQRSAKNVMEQLIQHDRDLAQQILDKRNPNLPENDVIQHLISLLNENPEI